MLSNRGKTQVNHILCKALQIGADILWRSEVTSAIKSLTPDSGHFSPTDLCPNHLRQSANEVWGGVHAQFECLFIDYFPYRKPQGGFEPLIEALSNAHKAGC